MKCDDSLYPLPNCGARSQLWGLQPPRCYNGTHPHAYVLTRRLLCEAKSECCTSIYIHTHTHIYMYTSVLSREFAAFRIRPPGRKWRCSFNCAFPRSHKTGERSPVVGERNCPLLREKVTDQRLHPTRSSLNLPSNDARGLALHAQHACI